jgi:vacuolar iron transporter family protein
MEFTPDMKKRLLEVQRLELTEHLLYKRLADSVQSNKNKRILSSIAKMEKSHYEFFKKYTKQDVKPHAFKLKFYYFLSRLFGITFGVKLMEREEKVAQHLYSHIIKDIPQAKKLLQEEEEHEQQVINMLHETKLEYIGSVVLGLNDALVELTGALAGLTFAFQKTKLIAIAGLITGIAASLSMAASEYLSTKSEKTTRHPVTAAIYTGVAYFFTVIVLVLPFLLMTNAYAALPVTISLALLIIFTFTFYTSITQHASFWKRFGEMAAISLGVAGLTFLIGLGIRTFIGVEI